MSVKKLPSMEHSFTLEVKGSETGRIFQGSFTYQRPNLRVQSEISKTTARLNEDLKNLDEDTKFLHKVLASLRHTLKNSPDWWKECDHGYDLYDMNVIMDIYKETVDFENSWFEKVWSEDKAEEKKPDEPKAEQAS